MPQGSSHGRRRAPTGLDDASTSTAEADRGAALDRGVVHFDVTTTSIDAVQRAAYKLSDRLSVDIQCSDGLTVVLHPLTPGGLDEIAAEFRNEVLDQTLRERIRDESEAARNLILAFAFSQTGLVIRE